MFVVSQPSWIPTSKNIDNDDIEFIKGLREARAQPKYIADVLTNRKGYSFKASNVRNLIKKAIEPIAGNRTIEEVLENIRDDGGMVKYEKKENSNSVDVLLVQTKNQRTELRRSKPEFFEVDTTFKTQIRTTSVIIVLAYHLLVARLIAISLVYM